MWERYFDNMSRGMLAPPESYKINQRGNGIGQFNRGRQLYRIPDDMIGSGPGKPTVVSSVQQGLMQARAIKRKRSRSRSHSRKRRRTVKRKGKQKVRKTKRGRRKKKSRSKKRTHKQIRSKRRRRKRDRLS